MPHPMQGLQNFNNSFEFTVMLEQFFSLSNKRFTIWYDIKADREICPRKILHLGSFNLMVIGS